MAGRPPNPNKEAPIFGKRLAYYRKKLGLSQESLAKRLDVPRDTIAYYELRAKNPTMGFILKASKVLGISPTKLLVFDEKPKSRSRS
jgi:transcriptional regulator with XRE-family HTH domain